MLLIARAYLVGEIGVQSFPQIVLAGPDLKWGLTLGGGEREFQIPTPEMAQLLVEQLWKLLQVLQSAVLRKTGTGFYFFLTCKAVTCSRSAAAL